MAATPIDAASVVVANPAQVSVSLGDEVAILGLASGQYYGVREVAARVWELVQQPISITELAEILAGEYDAPVETLRSDLLAYASALAREGLLDIRDTGG